MPISPPHQPNPDPKELSVTNSSKQKPAFAALQVKSFGHITYVGTKYLRVTYLHETSGTDAPGPYIHTYLQPSAYPPVAPATSVGQPTSCRWCGGIHEMKSPTAAVEQEDVQWDLSEIASLAQ